MKTQNVAVVAAVPEARVAMLILTWLTIEQVTTRYEEPTQTRLHHSSFSFQDSREIDRKNAQALWEACTFKISR